MSQRITKRTVDRLENGDTMWDANVKGFGVRRRNEVIAYFVKYRVGSGRTAPQRMVTIGRHGSPWTPKTARDRAIELLHDARQGRDPSATIKPEEKSMTVADLCDLYFEGIETRVLDGKGRPKKPRTIETDRSNVERHVKPLLGKKRLDQVTRLDIERFQRDVAAGKTALQQKTKRHGLARVRGGKGIAARTTSVLAAILNWAVQQSLLKENPAKGVTLFKTKTIIRYLTADETAKLGEAMRAADSEWREWEDAYEKAVLAGTAKPRRRGEDPIALAAIFVLLMTGARKMVVLGMRWTWIDFEKSFIRVPDEASKTVAQTIYVDKRVLDVLRSMPRMQGNPFVFPGRKEGKHLVGLRPIYQRILRRAGLEKLRIHDMRHNLATDATDAGVNVQSIGKILGHRDGRSTRRYSHVPEYTVRRVTEESTSRITGRLNWSPGRRPT